MPLTLKQKKSVLKKIRKTSAKSMYEPLLELIKQGVSLPMIGSTSPLKEYLMAYEASQNREKYAQLQLEIIQEHLKEFGCREFMEALSLDTTDTEQFSDKFIEYFANHFDWPLTLEPSVELTIVKGKVYWKIVQGDDVLYDNAGAKGKNSSDFFIKNKAIIITMNWSNFRRFKDAGKRTSSAEITKTRFFDECSELSEDVTKKIPKKSLQRKSVVTKIWEELKKRGLIDNNNRLTHAWYSYSGSLLLDCVNNIADKFETQQDKKETSFIHTYIAQALNNASINSEYRRTLPGDFQIFRPARTLRVWKSTGKLSFPSSVEHPVHQWDVGSYLELKKHEASGDELDHDHIPSQCWMQQDITQQLSNHDIDTEQYNAEIECDNDWGCMEVQAKWHHEGLTHKKPRAVQLRMKRPFYEEFNYYLNRAIEENPSPQYLIEIIGAFRYLFSCHIKEKFTTYSYGFFENRPKLVDEIDTLLLEKLSRASVNL
ncbi:MAG: hypothetical protein P1U36_06800 [Legionellaceae bacterium]|nr:hypothetical protein [Legionellaceae bacterium]